jgi:hypothetical protein
MVNDTFDKNAADLHILRPAVDGEDALVAHTASEIALLVSGALEGELTGRQTNATSRAGSGQRCIETAIAVIEHESGLLAEHQTFALVVRASGSALRAARDGSPEHRREALDALRGAIADDAALPGDVRVGLRRVATATIDEAPHSDEVGWRDPAALVRAIADAEVGTAASDALGPLRRRVQGEARRLVHQRDAFVAVGRADAARGIEQGLVEWSSAVLASLVQHAQQQDDDAETHLGAASEAVAEMDVDRQPASTGWLASIRKFFEDFLYSTERPAIDATLRESLERHLEARLSAAAARALRAAVSAAVQPKLDEAAVDRIVLPVTLLRDGAERAVLALDERARDRQRRVNGIFLPAHPAMRGELVNRATAMSDSALVEVLIHGPISATLADGGEINQDRLEDAVLTSARRLTRPLRDASLAQAIDHLSPEQLDGLAKLLVSPSPGLAFRPGHPTPAVYRRVAVPGGSSGVLGQAVRRRAPEIDITPIDTASQPFTAFGVATTEVFAPNELAGFHGSWRDALEAARRDGTAARLVSDRRLLDMADGILSDEDIDEIIVRAVACDAIASSKETADHGGVGGTWYLMAEGQTERPAQIDPARLDAVFRGLRLGRSVAEIRRTFRNNPRHRDWVAERWAVWCDSTAGAERVARLGLIISTARLPSDDLVPVCRDLKNLEAQRSRSPLAGVA